MASSSLKAYLKGREFLIFISCEAWMAPHPTDPMMPDIPMRSSPGETLRKGRNRTATRKARRAIARMANHLGK